MRIMDPLTPMFILWIYSAVAWDSYIGRLSPGWYEYNRYYTEEECITWRDEFAIPRLKKDGQAACLPTTPGMQPRPFAILLEES